MSTYENNKNTYVNNMKSSPSPALRRIGRRCGACLAAICLALAFNTGCASFEQNERFRDGADAAIHGFESMQRGMDIVERFTDFIRSVD